MALKKYESFPLLDQYLSYLTVIRGRSKNTITEYRTDILMFLNYINQRRNADAKAYELGFVDKEYLSSITLADMYAFIGDNSDKSAPGTRARKIVSIRQFWKYLKSKAHVIDVNIAEELETPKIPKRIPRYLSLEESVRLLIASAMLTLITVQNCRRQRLWYKDFIWAARITRNRVKMSQFRRELRLIRRELR